MQHRCVEPSGGGEAYIRLNPSAHGQSSDGFSLMLHFTAREPVKVPLAHACVEMMHPNFSENVNFS